MVDELSATGYSGRNIGNATYDWNFNSVPQPYAMNRQISQPRRVIEKDAHNHSNVFNRGKMVGGSTGLNLMAWDRASKNEYDAWALLSGDAGWSFDRLLPYLKKVENLSNVGNNYPGISAAEQVAATKAFPYLDSFTGPVNVSTTFASMFAVADVRFT
jgi:choline dehydrogenase-like flavoprotein